ncbi:MAG: hypothetical protein PS018_07885 [bacterium]|nr:hypothetical protein [bacterium]
MRKRLSQGIRVPGNRVAAIGGDEIGTRMRFDEAAGAIASVAQNSEPVANINRTDSTIEREALKCPWKM